MKKNIILLLALCTMLSGCGKEKQPQNAVIPDTQNQIIDEQQKEEEPKQEDEKQSNEQQEEQKPVTEPILTEGLDNKRVGWSFGSIEKRSAELCERYNAIYASQKQDKSLYLTFDEGYENGYTAQILDVLKNNNVPAAFFITGPYLESEPDLVKRMIDEGHTVGNHTYDHPSMPEWSDEKITADIQKLEKLYKDKFGATMKYLRPPKGDFSERTLALTQSLGYTTVFWKFAYADWDPNNQKGTDFAYNTVTTKVKDGDVILLHAVSKDNANALDSIIKHFKEEGYTFKSLDQF